MLAATMLMVPTEVVGIPDSSSSSIAGRVR